MPNGGEPMHMILYPKNNDDYVTYCMGGVIRLYSRKVWDEEK